MADKDSENSSEFSWGYFENTNDSFDVPEIGSDISVSPVSTPDLSPVNSSSESDSEDEDLAWRPNLRKPNNKPFTEAVSATFKLRPRKNELDFFLKFITHKNICCFYLFIRISIHVSHKQIMKYTRSTPGGTYTSSMLEVFWICIQIRPSKISQLYSTKV